MKEITLKEYLEKVRQVVAAEEMGITQARVSQLKTTNADVRIVLKRGKFDHWYEIKRRGKAA